MQHMTLSYTGNVIHITIISKSTYSIMILHKESARLPYVLSIVGVFKHFHQNIKKAINFKEPIFHLMIVTLW